MDLLKLETKSVCSAGMALMWKSWHFHKENWDGLKLLFSHESFVQSLSIGIELLFLMKEEKKLKAGNNQDLSTFPSMSDRK